MNLVGGQLLNMFDPVEVNNWVEIMKKLPANESRTNICHGVDDKNVLHQWFQKTIFSRITSVFGNELHLVFGMFLDEKQPWGVHTDAYHVKNHPDRKPALSFLIPYSVDHDVQLVTKSQTIVFDQIRLRDEEKISDLPYCDDHPECATKIHQQHLSHNSMDVLRRLTIQGQYHWQPGSLIYWDSHYVHDSDNFIANGYNSKQAIVIHTYYQV